MKNNRTILWIPITIGAALALSACGGGGGGGEATTTVGTNTLTAISAPNARPAAANAYAAHSTLGDTAGEVESLVTGVTISTGGISAVKPVINTLYHLVGNSSAQLVTGVVSSIACPGGGTLSTDATLRDPNTLSNGDTARLTANACSVDGDVLSGTFSFVVSGVSGIVSPTGAWGATLDLQFTQFRVSSGAESGQVDGDMKLVVKQTSATSGNMTISGNSLRVTESQSGSVVADRTMKNYTATDVLSGATASSSANYVLSGTTPALGQFTFNITTQQPVVYTNGALTSGAVLVKGAPATVTMTVVNNSSVRLDYSANGDGVVTQSNVVSLAGLQSGY